MTDTGSTAQVFGERYEIRRKIARGGMADVFLARDRLLDRPVALKVLFPELSVDPSFVERFRREAQNAAKLSHPNIVSVYDWGEDANTYFIVMEFVDGKSLSAMLRENGPLPANRAATIGAEVAAALSAAHRNGVVHRDVKPGNVLIDDRGGVKVTDFGIARARNTTENLTQTGAVMGTATYFSPEQAQGHAVDQRSDVYSLGVVLYEMAAGQAPFSGDNPVTIAYKHVREEPPALQSLNREVPAGYAAIVSRAMAKAPGDRYATAEDLRADLRRFQSGQAVRARPVGVGGVAGAAADATRAVATTAIPSAASGAASATPGAGPSPSRPPQGDGHSVRGPLMLFLGLLALIGIGAFVLLSGVLEQDPPEQVDVPAVVGRSLAEAQIALRDAGLRSTVNRAEDDQPEGQVSAQDPTAPGTAAEGTTVRLTVSTGPPDVDVPNLVGQNIDAARRTLQALRLQVTTTETASDSAPVGQVTNQDPRANTTIERDGRITLTVSTGPQQVEVPDVVGSTRDAAAQTLSDAGLRTSAVTEESDQPAGLVIRTDPPARDRTARRTLVTITVSTGRTTTSSTTSSTTTTADDKNGNGNVGGNGNANGNGNG